MAGHASPEVKQSVEEGEIVELSDTEDEGHLSDSLLTPKVTVTNQDRKNNLNKVRKRSRKRKVEKKDKEVFAVINREGASKWANIFKAGRIVDLGPSSDIDDNMDFDTVPVMDNEVTINNEDST